jgi:hypothetical protein
MFISKYSAEEYYKAVDGPKEQHWSFTNREFNDAQSCHDRSEWLTTGAARKVAADTSNSDSSM